MPKPLNNQPGSGLHINLSIEKDGRNLFAGGLDILCRVTNTTALDADVSTLAFALYTQSGNMIYADGTTLKDVGIPVGGTILLRFPVEDELVKQWDSYGMSASEVRVTASFRNDED